jgi:hypothetical protein
VMGLALVETNLGTTLHVGIKQPIDDEGPIGRFVRRITLSENIGRT